MRKFGAYRRCSKEERKHHKKVIVLTFDEDGQPEHIIGRYNDTALGNTVKSKDYDSLTHGEVVGFRTYEHTHLLSLFESG